ncbi:lipase secretion chaperone [Ralstonia solanacearum]|uniref:lipase secretion chaperone n=1 Tax=Ralstonia solanacearum TaxID=305 RepID=UPI003217C41D
MLARTAPRHWSLHSTSVDATGPASGNAGRPAHRGRQPIHRFDNQAETDWHARYTAHARERDRLATFPGLSAADRAAQVAQLRQQTFPASNEALPAQALDGNPRRE